MNEAILTKGMIPVKFPTSLVKPEQRGWRWCHAGGAWWMTHWLGGSEVDFYGPFQKAQKARVTLSNN